MRCLYEDHARLIKLDYNISLRQLDPICYHFESNYEISKYNNHYLRTCDLIFARVSFVAINGN